MRVKHISLKALALGVVAMALTGWALCQSTPSSSAPASGQGSPQAGSSASATTPSSAPVPGAATIGEDQQVPAQPAASQSTGQSGTQSTPASATGSGAGAAPVTGDAPAKSDPKEKKPAPGSAPVAGDLPASSVNPDKIVEVGSQKVNVKPGSIDDVNAVGNRDIGARGIGNWYSVDFEIKMGKMYATELEKSTKLITDPVVVEYINRIGQNIVKNSDCKVPFTIKVIDSDEINAMALPGGFFYVNSGLILNADEEAELAGVMAHETAHVCAHHIAREMTRANYAQIGMVPLIFIGGWTGYGIYEAANIGIPMTFLKFSREFESQADYLGVQYMYRAGYDPQAFIAFFEKIQALEKRKPGLVAKAFSDHPQTPDRILHSQEEIARILPARDEYTVTTSEFDDVKARLARIENKRRLTDSKDTKKPSLRRAGTSTGDATGTAGASTPSDTSGDDDKPTLHRRDDQN
jgi:hypothetical protein